MRIKNLLYLLLALPMLMVACEENTPIDEVKDATVAIEVGEASSDYAQFTITSTDAEKVAYIVVDAAETAPNASEVLANGTAIEANKAVEVKAENLTPDTEYLIVAAAQNTKGVVKSTATVKTEAASGLVWELTSEAEVEFTAEGGEGTITYTCTLNDGGSGFPDMATEVSIACEAEWIDVDESMAVGEDIPFTVAANNSEAREATIAISYNNSVKFEVKVKQAEKPGDDVPVDGEVNFTASVYEVYYYGTQYSAAYNYQVYLSDNGLNESGYYKQDGVYYMLDLFAADSAENNNFTLPNGKYTASETSNAGTFGIGDYGALITMVGGVPTYSIYKTGSVTVTDGKIEAKIMMEDGSIHNVVYEGNLRFDGNEEPEPGPQEPEEATHTADKWLWGGASSYGNKYQVVGEGFSVDVHFPAQYAQESALAEGDYIWTSTTMFGYNDFENEFTTRSFTVDGTSVAVDSGSAKVAKSGDEYAIQLILDGRDGVKYVIDFNGKLNDKGEVSDNENIVMTSLAEGTHNSSYGFYTFKAANDNVTFDLLISDYQAKANSIADGSYQYAPGKSYVGTSSLFFVDNFKLDGVKYKPQGTSTMTVTNEGGNVNITINLFMDSGEEFVVVYNGPIGEGGNGGGTTPSQPTKLATPSVSGLVAGNTVTVSWQDVVGAKDYSVSLNGTHLQTVETAYITLTDLEYSTTYSVSVVANPADTAVNTASDAGTASFTTEADPNAGGNEGGNEGGNDEPTEDFTNWNFSAHYDTNTMVVTLTGKDDNRVITVKTNDLAFAKFYADPSHSSYFTDVTVDGVPTTDVTPESYVHVQQIKVSISLVINGVTYTGDSNGFSY